MTNPSSAETEALARARFVQSVRTRLRDFAGLNRLIEGEESDDRLIMGCLRLALSEVNGTPPLIGNRQVYQVPLYILVELTSAYLVSSAGMLHLRNDIAFATGSTSVQLPQAQTYPQVADRMFATARQNLSIWKIAQNLQLGLDSVTGVSSHLALLNAPRGAYDLVFSG